MHNRGRGNRRPPPVNGGCVQGPPPSQTWHTNQTWQNGSAPVLYPQLSLAPLQPAQAVTLQPPQGITLQPAHGVTLQPLIYQPSFWSSYQNAPDNASQSWGSHVEQPRSATLKQYGRGRLAGPHHSLQRKPAAAWQPQARGPAAQTGRGAPGRNPLGRGAPGRGAPGRGLVGNGPLGGGAPSRGTPGRGASSGQQSQKEHTAASARLQDTQDGSMHRSPPQRNGGLKKQGTGRSTAKMQRLAEEEAAPKLTRNYTAAERAEGARWQEERRRNFPTKANLAEKAKAAKARADMGALDPVTLDRRKRLGSILQLQRKMGLTEAAGTQDMLPGYGDDQFATSPDALREGRGRGWGWGRGRGRRNSRGRGRGRGQNYTRVEYHSSPSAGAKRLASESTLSNTMPSPKQQKTDAASREGNMADLLGLGEYLSSEEENIAEAGEVVENGHMQVQMDLKGSPVFSTFQGMAEQSAGHPDSGPAREPQQMCRSAAQADPPPADSETQAAGCSDLETGNVMDHPAHGLAGKPQLLGPQQNGRGRRHRHRQHNDNCSRQQLPPRRSPLLQKLLAKEVRLEHNHLLQCFRFLINNNFLQDVGSRPLVFPSDGSTVPDPQAGLREELLLESALNQSNEDSEEDESESETEL